MHNLLVSIIIPCYNYSRFIKDAIDSALNQTYENIEIIIVNDGSTDNSADVINTYLPNSKIVYIEQKNSGVSAARNNGIAIAAGDWILMLDADDCISPDYVKDAVELIENDCTIVNSSSTFTDKNLTPTGKVWFSNYVNHVWTDLLKENIMPVTGLFSKNKWKECGGYDSAIPGADDWEFWINMFKHGCFVKFLSPKKTYFKYRKHEISMEDSNNIRINEIYNFILNKHFSEATTREMKINALSDIFFGRILNKQDLNHYVHSEFSLFQIKEIFKNSEEYLNRPSHIIKIGEYSYIDQPITVIDHNYRRNLVIEIGKYTSIAAECKILLNQGSHFSECVSNFPFGARDEFKLLSKPEYTTYYKCGPITIGNDVWVGREVTIMPGVIIGDGAVISTNSLVTKDVAPYSVVGGTPAKLIKYRFSENTITQLLDIKWWDWPVAEVRKHLSLIQAIPTQEVLEQLLIISHSIKKQ